MFKRLHTRSRDKLLKNKIKALQILYTLFKKMQTVLRPWKSAHFLMLFATFCRVLCYKLTQSSSPFQH